MKIVWILDFFVRLILTGENPSAKEYCLTHIKEIDNTQPNIYVFYVNNSLKLAILVLSIF